MIPTINENTFPQEVLDSPFPVIVSFWAPWCGLCRIINPLLNGLQDEQGEQVKFVSVNADENFKLANTYRLTNLPTLLLIERGQVLCRFDHFTSHDDVRAAFATLGKILGGLANTYSYTA